MTVVELGYDPNQPRDDDGRWTDTGATGGSSGDAVDFDYLGPTWRRSPEKDAAVARFDALPDDTPVVVYHATSKTKAPLLVAAGRYESGHIGDGPGTASFTPGLYVTATAVNAADYGSVILRGVVRKGDLVMSEEAKTMRASTLGEAFFRQDSGAVVPPGIPVEFERVDRADLAVEVFHLRGTEHDHDQSTHATGGGGLTTESRVFRPATGVYSDEYGRLDVRSTGVDRIRQVVYEHDGGQDVFDVVLVLDDGEVVGADVENLYGEEGTIEGEAAVEAWLAEVGVDDVTWDGERGTEHAAVKAEVATEVAAERDRLVSRVLDAYSGSFVATTGDRITIGDVRRRDLERADVGRDYVEVTGSLYNADGVEVGTFHRAVYPDGKVYNHSLDIKPEFQGRGIGTAFLDKTEDALGAKTVKLTAVSVGKYAWAARGYRLDTGPGSATWASTRDRWISKARLALADTPEWRAGDYTKIDALAAVEAAWSRDRNAIYPSDLLAIDPALKSVLMQGPSWDAIRELDDDNLAASATIEVFHLQGSHDQATHGNWARIGGGRIRRPGGLPLSAADEDAARTFAGWLGLLAAVDAGRLRPQQAFLDGQRASVDNALEKASPELREELLAVEADGTDREAQRRHVEALFEEAPFATPEERSAAINRFMDAAAAARTDVLAPLAAKHRQDELAASSNPTEAAIAFGVARWTGDYTGVDVLRGLLHEGDDRAVEFREAIRAAPTTEIPLYRGMNGGGALKDQWRALEVGDTIGLDDLGSFSESEDHAREFGSIMVVMRPGAVALPIAHVSNTPEELEWVSAGRLRVVAIDEGPPGVAAEKWPGIDFGPSLRVTVDYEAPSADRATIDTGRIMDRSKQLADQTQLDDIAAAFGVPLHLARPASASVEVFHLRGTEHDHDQSTHAGGGGAVMNAVRSVDPVAADILAAFIEFETVAASRDDWGTDDWTGKKVGLGALAREMTGWAAITQDEFSDEFTPEDFARQIHRQADSLRRRNPEMAYLVGLDLDDAEWETAVKRAIQRRVAGEDWGAMITRKAHRIGQVDSWVDAHDPSDFRLNQRPGGYFYDPVHDIAYAKVLHDAVYAGLDAADRPIWRGDAAAVTGNVGDIVDVPLGSASYLQSVAERFERGGQLVQFVDAVGLDVDKRARSVRGEAEFIVAGRHRIVRFDDGVVTLEPVKDREVELSYDPSQPRAPAGTDNGGQWVSRDSAGRTLQVGQEKRPGRGVETGEVDGQPMGFITRGGVRFDEAPIVVHLAHGIWTPVMPEAVQVFRFDPGQPRHPAGSSQGGQWAPVGGVGDRLPSGAPAVNEANGWQFNDHPQWPQWTHPEWGALDAADVEAGRDSMDIGEFSEVVRLDDGGFVRLSTYSSRFVRTETSKWGPEGEEVFKPGSSVDAHVVHSPEFWRTTGGREPVGHLSTYSSGSSSQGEIIRIDVDKAHRRRGIATEMWKFGKKHIPNLRHSHALTEDGRAWNDYLDTEGLAVEVFHLQGQHDQQTHGNRGGFVGADGSERTPEQAARWAMNVWRRSFGTARQIREAALGGDAPPEARQHARALLHAIHDAPRQEHGYRVDHMSPPSVGETIDLPLSSVAARTEDASGFESFSDSLGLSSPRSTWLELHDFPAVQFDDGRESITSGRFVVEAVHPFNPGWASRPGVRQGLDRRLVVARYVGPSELLDENGLVAAAAVFRFDPGQPRHPAGSSQGGQWAPVGGVHTPVSPQDAVAALQAGERVTVDAYDAIGVVMEIGQADGGVVDLTKMTIAGDDYLFHQVPVDGRRTRGEMPQIPEAQISNFRTFLEDEGIRFEREVVDPTKVRSTQTELDATKVGQMVAKVRAGKFTNGHPPWVSSDDHILDGHHRWATVAMLAAAGQPFPPMEVLRVSLPIDKLLALADEFNTEFGVRRKTIAMAVPDILVFGYNPNQPRDDHGRWTATGGSSPVPRDGRDIWIYTSVPITAGAAILTGTEGLWDTESATDESISVARSLLEDIQRRPVKTTPYYSGHGFRPDQNVEVGDTVDVPLMAVTPEAALADVYRQSNEPERARHPWRDSNDRVLKAMAKATGFDSVDEAVQANPELKEYLLGRARPIAHAEGRHGVVYKFESSQSVPLRANERVVSGRYEVTGVEQTGEGGWYRDGDALVEVRPRMVTVRFVEPLPLDDDVAELACDLHQFRGCTDASCAPPPVGTGGSLPTGATGSIVRGADHATITTKSGELVRISGPGYRQMRPGDVDVALRMVADTYDVIPTDGGPPSINVTNVDSMIEDGVLERLAEKYPSMSEEDRRGKLTALGGSVRRSDPLVINLNADADYSRKIRKTMPVEKSLSGVEATVLHEYGHSHHFSTDFGDRQRSITAELFRGPIKSLSPYGQSSPAEAYAEAFMEYIGTRGATKNQAANKYAKAFMWDHILAGQTVGKEQRNSFYWAAWLDDEAAGRPRRTPGQVRMGFAAEPVLADEEDVEIIEVLDDDDGPIVITPDGVAELGFDPNQPRDDHGRWTATGGAARGGVDPSARFVSPEVQARLDLAEDIYNAPLQIGDETFTIRAWVKPDMSSPHDVHVLGSLYNADDVEIAAFERVIEDRTVHNEFFELEAEWQGRGIGQAFLDATEKQLVDKMGVRVATVHAVDVGRYAWAARGYATDDMSAVDEWSVDAVRRGSVVPRDKRHQVAAVLAEWSDTLERGGYVYPADLLSIDPSLKQVFLEGPNWDGRREITPLTYRDRDELTVERIELAASGMPGGLRHYWVNGEGAAKIGWGTGGDFTRCVGYLREHVADPEGTCANLHRDATGMWPGDKRNRNMAVQVFHLQGQHDQSTHGNWADGGGNVLASAFDVNRNSVDGGKVMEAVGEAIVDATNGLRFTDDQGNEYTVESRRFYGFDDVTGKIIGSDGRPVAWFQRAYHAGQSEKTVEPRGTMAGGTRPARPATVVHKNFHVDPEMQGRGIGKAFSEASLEMYANLGVERIELIADDVGRYAWAAQGYRLDLTSPTGDSFDPMRGSGTRVDTSVRDHWVSAAERVLPSLPASEQVAARSVLTSWQSEPDGIYGADLLAINRSAFKDVFLEGPVWHGYLDLKPGLPLPRSVYEDNFVPFRLETVQVFHLRGTEHDHDQQTHAGGGGGLPDGMSRTMAYRSTRPVYEHPSKDLIAVEAADGSFVIATPDSTRSVVSREWPLMRQRIVDFANGAARAHEMAPTDRPPKVSVVAEDATEAMAFVDPKGARYPADTINLNVAADARFTWEELEKGWIEMDQFMPSATIENLAEYVGAHEQGHVRAALGFDDAALFQDIAPMAMGQGRDARTEGLWGSMSKYARSHSAEAHAEAFAEWVMTGGQTTNRFARAYADIFGWDDDIETPLAAAAGSDPWDDLDVELLGDTPAGPVHHWDGDVVELAYDPSQPRVPAGSSQGGQWTDGGGRYSGTAAAETERVAALARRGVDPAEFDGPVMHRGIAIKVSDELKHRIDTERYSTEDPDDFNRHLHLGPVIVEQLLGFGGHQGIERTGGIGQSWTTRESVAESVSAGPGMNLVVKVTARPRQSDIVIQEVDLPDGGTQWVDHAGTPIGKGRETDLVGGEMEVRIHGQSPVDIVDVQIATGSGNWESVWGDEGGFGAGAEELYRYYPSLRDENLAVQVFHLKGTEHDHDQQTHAGGGSWSYGNGKRLTLKDSRRLSEKQTLASAQRIADDVADYFGGTPGKTKAQELTEWSEPGKVEASDAVPALRFERNGMILVHPDELDRMADPELGVADMRKVAHEAVHAYVSGAPYTHGFAHDFEEGAAELLSLRYWADQGQPFDDRDAIRKPGGGGWTTDPMDHLAGSTVYGPQVVEVARRAASKVGSWDDRDAIFAEVDKMMRSDSNGRLDFRDSTDPGFALPSGADWPDDYDAARAVTRFLLTGDLGDFRLNRGEDLAVQVFHLKGTEHDHDQQTHAGGDAGVRSDGARFEHADVVALADQYDETDTNAAARFKHEGAARVVSYLTEDERQVIADELNGLRTADMPPGIGAMVENGLDWSVETGVGPWELPLGVAMQVASLARAWRLDVPGYETTEKFSQAVDAFKANGDAAALSATIDELGISVAHGAVDWRNAQWQTSSVWPSMVAFHLAAADNYRLSEAKAALRGYYGSGSYEAAVTIREYMPDTIDTILAADRFAVEDAIQMTVRRDNRDTITVWRGVKATGHHQTNLDGATVIQSNPLSSWTVHEPTAREFAGQYSTDGGWIVKAEVPVDQIVAMSTVNGWGSLREREVVLLGNPTPIDELTPINRS